MKTLKLNHDLAQAVIRGEKKTTWRLFDDKNLSVNDEVRLIDKIDPERPETWQAIGLGRINRIIEKRLDQLTSVEMTDYGYESLEHMLAIFKKYYGNDVRNTTQIKVIQFDFTPLNLVSDVNKTTKNSDKMLQKVIIYADGGSRGNPGPSASGYVIIDPDTQQTVVDKGTYLGVTTNNQAEYLSLKDALQEAKNMGATDVEVYMDSQLVVNQLKGTFKVKNRDLYPLHDTVKALIADFSHFSISHIPREQNHLADNAVNRAMDHALDAE